ncbi:NUDIX domain-containing protein [Nocardioides sp. OK12]|uniref:NUDIX domain-containing protein n=1 Tax=Nocardioides sp. OK12 TaxID=2758661 RepID=UPI0021C28AF3|nr:NUDIX domain-containing protein [Nocardioides sp. OK12]
MRQAVRALVVDDDDHVLLVHFRWEGLALPDGFWACPGGGIEPDEDAEAALRRELVEELGLVDPDVRGPVWRLTRMMTMADFDGQTDVTYLVRAPRFVPRPQVDLAAENVHGLRWFSPQEVAAGEVAFSPRDLAVHLARVLADGVPERPREIAALA